jgi:DNA-binding transcriptional LysR family regulator
MNKIHSSKPPKPREDLRYSEGSVYSEGAKTMNLEDVKLSQLRALVAVATHGNFSEAALSLAISQSAVSHAIATLEAQLGVILLYRGRQGASLTPVGARILKHAQEMLRSLEKLGKEADLSKGLQGGQVRIASFRSVATHVLPDVISQFRASYPAIAVTITEYRGDEGVEDALRNGRADIGFSCLPPSEEFECWELMQDEYIVLLPPKLDMPESHLTWAQIQSYPLIMPAKTDYCSTIIRNYFAQSGHELNAAYEIMEDSTIVSMVMKGLGITIIAKLAAEPLPPEIQVRCPPTPLTRTIQVATLEGALHPPSVYAFLDTLRQDWSLVNNRATAAKSLSPGAISTPLERSIPSG